MGKYKGFTIVELLIVIVVISILAVITMTAFNGIQASARDTERRTDIRQLAQQLEVYHSDNGFYPLFSQLSSSSWRAANMPSVKDGLVTPPGRATPGIFNVTSPTISQYGYYTVNSCVNGQCAKYRLLWRSEVTNQIETHIGATGL
ncbi:MAG TPA: prepilin-type N-terminal cleavage/methylation domain-containing protein [Verrucomicrobiae bacterium]|nr:prepilin-type N-terminal cleavage/methylation domain-containing protein [Verrucomicrobiae bacterium]